MSLFFAEGEDCIRIRDVLLGLEPAQDHIDVGDDVLDALVGLLRGHAHFGDQPVQLVDHQAQLDLQSQTGSAWAGERSHGQHQYRL